MTAFVQNVVNVPAVSDVFNLAVPKSIAGQVGVGNLDIVPFVAKRVQGLIYKFIDFPSVLPK